ncbi:MAG TPA: type II secretion system protein [bacterium]|jgi:prepilin-type N-terminal cleavage/methylation domain-containing protein
MKRNTNGGFTLIELLVVITIIGILAAIALPNYIKAKDKAKEAEVKANLHTIQISLERYMTDNSKYPDFLMGGDVQGWLNWHSQHDSEDHGYAILQDSLVEYDYITSYPDNPFIDDGIVILNATRWEDDPTQGEGDPRFGYKGNVMGNGLEDFFYFEYRAGGLPLQWTSEFETRRTLPPNQANYLGFPELDGSETQGLHYMFAGRRISDNSEQGYHLIYTHWPGNFMYRGLGSHIIERQGWTHYDPGYWVPAKTDRYILGGYGTSSTTGMDVIRVHDRTPDGEEVLYRMPPPWPDPPDMSFGFAQIRCGWPPWTGSGGCGLPEVSGGGDAYTGPRYPYHEQGHTQYIYGSPDGVEDGLILILAAGAEQDLNFPGGGK